ncbi:hypothetical protein [Haloarchaeobius sp. TZWWS8]|uniref:hypothetical protein n=1 Tax=Haloarchaeobius sp. TZWWS8 TaxID=3446121 RepID=UPI003EB9C1EA
MASEEQVNLSVRLPPELGEWVRERAAEQGTDPDELVQQLLSAYRTVAELSAENDGEVAALFESEHDPLDDRLAAQREEFMELVEDVRERVIQVKVETDEKAPADHSHDELADRVEELSALADDVDGLRADLDTVQDDLAAGFENYEDIVTYLVETTDDLDEKVTTLARVLVDVRGSVDRLAAAEARRAEAEALQLAANRAGVERARCDECETPVTVALLSEPTCPHCASTFSDVVPKSTFGPFGSHRLSTGDPPALPEGSAKPMEADLEAEFLSDDSGGGADGGDRR